jgi:hypothetical protein
MGRKKKNINIIDNINIFINKENEKDIIEKIKTDFIKNNGLVILVPTF